jgi:exonuclease SbcD
MTLEFAQKSKTEELEIIVDTEDIRPDELFALFYEKQNERELDEVQKELLNHIWKEVEGAE